MPLPIVSTPLSPRAATLMTSACASTASLAPGPPRLIWPASPVWRMSIVPRSARRVPFTLALLVAPVAKMVTLPPGPGAAASSRERSSPVLEILIATPLGFPLLSVMFPPLALRPHRQACAQNVQSNTAAAAWIRIRVAKRAGAIRIYDRNSRAHAGERTGGEGKIRRRNPILVTAAKKVGEEGRGIDH